MKKIIHFLHIKAPPSKVFWALTTQEGLAGWWSTDLKVEGGLGAVIHFHFVADFNPDMEVTALEEDQLIGWKCIGGHDNWLEDTFSFELRPSAGATDLMFEQAYARELSDEIYGNYNFNWGYYIGSLKELCETGIGKPYPAARAGNGRP